MCGRGSGGEKSQERDCCLEEASRLSQGEQVGLPSHSPKRQELDLSAVDEGQL